MTASIQTNNFIEIGFNELNFLSVVWMAFRKRPKWIDPYAVLNKTHLTFGQQKPILRLLIDKGIVLSTKQGYLRGHSIIKIKAKASECRIQGRAISNGEKFDLYELFPSNANLVGQAPKENALVNSSKTSTTDPRMTKVGKNGLKLLGAIWSELSTDSFTKLEIEAVAKKASLNASQAHLVMQKLVETRFLARNKSNKFIMEFKRTTADTVKINLQPGTHEIEYRGTKYRNGETINLNDLFNTPKGTTIITI